jgi:hypothetical protein
MVPSFVARCEAQYSCPVSKRAHSSCPLKRQTAPSSAIATCVPPRRTQPWTGRTLGTDAVPGLSRCSTPPDPLNCIHNRRRGLSGRCFGESEPLRKSRYDLRWSHNRRRCEPHHNERTDVILSAIAHIAKFNIDEDAQQRMLDGWPAGDTGG